MTPRVLMVLAMSVSAAAQGFDVASVKLSDLPVGPDYNNKITVQPKKFAGRNVTLKRLIGEAYSLQPFQIAGPKWMTSAEYDVDAKSAEPIDAGAMRARLRTLLMERFHLKKHDETKDQRVYELMVDKGGPKFHEGEAIARQPGIDHFHGDLQEFAQMLTIRLSMQSAEDPSKPAMATGVGFPVVDKTGLSGVYDFNLNAKPELGVDPLAFWQHIVQQQLGLKLEARRAAVVFLVVDGADRTPVGN
jgi:uncharacterized protein (TIGR03435 family)